MNLKTKELNYWYEHNEDNEYENWGKVYTFRNLCWMDDLLKTHRSLYENDPRLTAFGDRCVQYVYKLLVDEMPNDFKFLEIGVNNGQITSLVQALATRENKKCEVVGVTPLSDINFDNGINRLPNIKYVHETLNITFDNTTIYDGYSQNPDIINKVKTHGMFDMIFIDGDHSYRAYFEDQQNYIPMLKVGGFLVIDDTNNYKKFPNFYDPIHKRQGGVFQGLDEVSNATRDYLETNKALEEVLTVMHVRVFQKVA